MFDTIAGLPLHPLVVHAVVILAPVAALVVLAYAVLPRWQSALRWPALGLAAIAGGTALVAKETGERFLARVFSALDSTSSDYADKARMITDHENAGSLMAKVALGFLAVTAVATLWTMRPTRPTRPTRSTAAEAGGAVVLVSRAVLVIASLALLGATVVAGHSGATAVWSQLVK